MNTNDYIDLAKQVIGTPQGQVQPDSSEQAKIGLELAKRQTEKPKEEPPAVPPLGSMPIPN